MKKFLVDAMLGRLARFLRIFGYDTLYANDLEKKYGIIPISDKRLLEYALKDGRIIITRDNLFHKKAGDHSIYLTGVGIYNYLAQLKQKIDLNFNFDMNHARCSVCNSPLEKIQDKERIKHELTTNLFRYRFCPHLKTELAEAVLRHFPEIVAPDSDPNWDFHKQYEEVPGAIKIVKKERSGDFYYREEFWADGVRPKGLVALTDVLTDAFNELKLTHTSVKALLK